MRRFSFVWICAFLIAAAACSSTTSDSGGGEIRSEADVQNLFEAIMPELIDALTDLADQQFASKQGDGSSVQCPGGGAINVNLTTGQTTLAECSAGGAVISGTVALFVQSLGPSQYEAFFSGILTVSGTFTGTLDVVDSILQWSDPPTDDNTYWSVTVRIGEEYLFASSDNSGGNGGGNGEEKCANGDFILDPGSPTQCTITREVCFHSVSDLGGCDVYNYRIPPSTDFSEFMDIFYGGSGVGCEESMLGEFMENGSNWLLFGRPNGQPPEDVPGSPQIVVTGGSYSVMGQNRNGSFVFYWPTQNMPNPCF